MKPFRYLRDPLFLTCIIVYAINRCIIKPYLPNEFSRSYLNDCLCLPMWVPVMLLVMRKLRLRTDDSPPDSVELIVPLILWSLVFERYLPATSFFSRYATSDYHDVFCYTAGGLFAANFWKWWYLRPTESTKLRLNS